MTLESLNRRPACLGSTFYKNDTCEVAKSLLGKILVRKLESSGSISYLAGCIIETEAYGYRDDPASHAYNGVRTRNSIMFGNTGCLYVYFIYGKHFCANLTARKDDTEAGAVLLRAILPIEANGRFKNPIIGPGRVTKSLSINLAHNGIDVTQETSLVSIHQGLEIADLITNTRIGISKATDRPWRYTAIRFAAPSEICVLQSQNHKSNF